MYALLFRYKCFDLSSVSESFKLLLGPNSYIKDESNISDALSYHDGQPFSTHDKDNDATSMHCAKQSQVIYLMIHSSISLTIFEIL